MEASNCNRYQLHPATVDTESYVLVRSPQEGCVGIFTLNKNKITSTSKRRQMTFPNDFLFYDCFNDRTNVTFNKNGTF